MSWMDWLLDLLFIDCFADWLVWLIYQPWSTLIGWLVGNWWFDWLVCWLIWRLCDWHWLQFEFMYWFMDLLICCWLLLYAIALLISWSVDLLIYSIVHRHIIKWLICLLSVQSSNVHWFLDLLIRSNIYLFMAANLLGGKKTAALAIRGNIWRHSSFCEDLQRFSSIFKHFNSFTWDKYRNLPQMLSTKAPWSCSQRSRTFSFLSLCQVRNAVSVWQEAKRSHGPISPAQHLRLFQDLSSLSDWSVKLRNAESWKKRGLAERSLHVGTWKKRCTLDLGQGKSQDL